MAAVRQRKKTVEDDHPGVLERRLVPAHLDLPWGQEAQEDADQQDAELLGGEEDVGDSVVLSDVGYQAYIIDKEDAGED